jgi:hypothetical protein
MTERKFARYDAYMDSAWRAKRNACTLQIEDLKIFLLFSISNVDKKSHEDEIR